MSSDDIIRERLLWAIKEEYPRASAVSRERLATRVMEILNDARQDHGENEYWRGRTDEQLESYNNS